MYGLPPISYGVICGDNMLSFGIVRYDPVSPASVDELLSRGDRLIYQQNSRKRRQEERGKTICFMQPQDAFRP